MASKDALTDSVRIRIEPEKKRALERLYAQRGTTISQAVRGFFDEELASQANPLDRFDAIMDAADAKADSYGAPEPTIDDIVAFVDRIREERSPAVTVRA